MKPPKKRRLALVVSNFPQGSETFIVSKFLGLLGRGWDVHILCNHFEAGAWESFSQLTDNARAKKHVHQAWPRQPRWLAALLWLPALLWSFCLAPQSTWRYLISGWRLFGMDILKRFYLDAPFIRLRPDIVHFEFGSLAVGWTHLKEVLDTKFSASFRGYDLNFVALDEPDYYGELWRTMDGCHGLSKHLWERAKERGCPPNMYHSLIPPAVDLAVFPEPKNAEIDKVGTHHRPLRVLSIGRLEYKKGYEHALQAVKYLLDNGLFCEYQIIGAGDYQTALYFARHQMPLTDSVKFCGSLPHDDVLKKLKWADILLHPSLSEGFCNAVLEAQAMRVPVVCSDAGGLPENIQDGVTGFIVPRRDPAAMAEKLALLAQDGELRRRMGAAGRKRVENHFLMEQQLDAFEAFYEQL